MNKTTTERADGIVAGMHKVQASRYPKFPRLLNIHYGLDVDSRKVWFYFFRPGLRNVRMTRTPVVKNATSLIREFKTDALKTLSKRGRVGKWRRYSGPVMRYQYHKGLRIPSGYNDDTWVYILTMSKKDEPEA